MMQEVGYGDIVQIHPSDKQYGGCFMFVREVQDNGIIGHVQIPGKGNVSMMKSWKDVEWVGQSMWDKK